MRHLIDLDDFSLEEIYVILKKAFLIKNNPEKFLEAKKGTILATLFFEPSTRTQFSFQTAIYKLGGQTIGFSNALNSSVSKGESLKDTIKIVSGYADFLVLRHFLQGTAFLASLFSSCPIINAGDGSHLHPTQTLTDIFTILEEKKTLTRLSIGVCGDLKFSRTVRSLIKLLIRFKNNRFILISSENFKLSEDLKQKILDSGNEFLEFSSLEKAITEIDVLYVTRIQKERFEHEEEIKKDLILDSNTLSCAKEDLIIMHPFPRVNEIKTEVDKDKRSVYFKQALNGVFVRMAVILELLNFKKNEDVYFKDEKLLCKNEKCITNFEKEIPKLFKKEHNEVVCGYCEGKCLQLL